MTTSFARVLHADGPDPERQKKLGLYSWLVGQWEMEVTTILETNPRTPIAERFTLAGFCKAAPYKTCG